MDCAYIAFCHFPSVVIDHKPGWIKAFYQIVHSHGLILLPSVHINIGYAPAFVKRHPGHDAWMVIIPFYDFKPFLCIALHSGVRVEARGSHFAPYKKAHLIRMIQETGIFRLLMLPAAIESHFLHQADVPHKIPIRGRSQYSVAPIPLIQHELEIVWIIVQIGNPVLHVYLTHAEIAVHAVGKLSSGKQAQVNIIENRVLRCPAAAHSVRHAVKNVILGKMDGPPEYSFIVYQITVTADLFPVEVDLRFQIHIRRAAGKFGFQNHHVMIHIRSKFHTGDMGLLHRLHPYTLPDTCGTRIPDIGAFLLPELFSPGDRFILRRIINRHGKSLFPVPQVICDIRAETGIAACMLCT